MQETKDLKAKLEIDRKNLEGQVASRQGKVKDLQAARDLLKQDSPQYADAEQAFMKEAIEFDTWSKITQATLQGQQKRPRRKRARKRRHHPTPERNRTSSSSSAMISARPMSAPTATV